MFAAVLKVTKLTVREALAATGGQQAFAKDLTMSILAVSEPFTPAIDFAPPGIIKRQTAQWRGLRAEILRVTEPEPFEYGFRAPAHLLIAAERAERYEGVTEVEGLPVSTLREFSRKLTFIPAGTGFYCSQKPRVLTQATYFYIDPDGPLVSPELGFRNIDFKPRLFFFDPNLWDTVSKLKAQVENPTDPHYAEALSVVLLHELIRLNNGVVPVAPLVRGGLAAWQQKRVARFIEEHLSEVIPLAALADMAGLSPYHFARAFKHSFGVPPHRYHMTRRVAQAKALLAKTTVTVTDIALQVGFSETSSFTAAFRKLTGHSPTEFRRSLA
jgi:AraC family transcriptional regulator